MKKNILFLLTILLVNMSLNGENNAMEYIPSVQEQLRFSNKEQTREIIIGGIYQHHRNKYYYKVLAIGTSTENIEVKLVIYEALYDNQVSKVWVRPLENFLEMVMDEGSLVERFSHIENPIK